MSYPFQQHDGGRSTSKRPKQKRDCIIRAIVLTTGRPYDEVYDEIAALGRKCGRGTAKELWKPYMDGIGTKTSFPPTAGMERMHLDTFIESHPEGRWIVQLAGHLTAVIGGRVYDTFMSRGSACVYAAWRIEK